MIGSKASIERWDEQPNQLAYEVEGEDYQCIERGAAYCIQKAYLISGQTLTGALPLRWIRQIGEKTNFWFPDIRAGVMGVK